MPRLHWNYNARIGEPPFLILDFRFSIIPCEICARNWKFEIGKSKIGNLKSKIDSGRRYSLFAIHYSRLCLVQSAIGNASADGKSKIQNRFNRQS